MYAHTCILNNDDFCAPIQTTFKLFFSNFIFLQFHWIRRFFKCGKNLCVKFKQHCCWFTIILMLVCYVCYWQMISIQISIQTNQQLNNAFRVGQRNELSQKLNENWFILRVHNMHNGSRVLVVNIYCILCITHRHSHSPTLLQILTAAFNCYVYYRSWVKRSFSDE